MRSVEQKLQNLVNSSAANATVYLFCAQYDEFNKKTAPRCDQSHKYKSITKRLLKIVQRTKHLLS